MDFSPIINGTDRARLDNQVNAFNKVLNAGREVKQGLDKDDFLKILLTQLTHQDPTQPMEDREFVAQMAQFSALEQMTNLSREFSQVTRLVTAGQAMALLGKTVEYMDGDAIGSGVVEKVTSGEYPQVLVNGSFVDFEQVKSVLR